MDPVDSNLAPYAWMVDWPTELLPAPPPRSVFDPSLVKFVDLETLDIESHVDLISFPPKCEDKKKKKSHINVTHWMSPSLGLSHMNRTQQSLIKNSDQFGGFDGRL